MKHFVLFQFVSVLKHRRHKLISSFYVEEKQLELALPVIFDLISRSLMFV